MSSPRTALVGIGGYGRVHLGHLLDFHRRGALVLAAVVAFPPEGDDEAKRALAAIGCEVFASFDALLAAAGRLQLELAVVPTPIHLHARMAVALMQAGVDVLVEKPLAATVADGERVIAAARSTGRHIFVGYQYLHAPEVLALKQRLRAGAIGPVQRIVVHAAWPRSHAYYTRNAWAGRLRLGDDWVLDSPVSNAMSHFLMVMLFLAGADAGGVAEPVDGSAELYRAQAIETFDTAVIHLRTAAGVRLDFYGTHSSRETSRPTLRITGAAGTAEWVQDTHARVAGPGQSWEQPAKPEADTRERMLQDVLARRRGEPAPGCTPEMALVHVRCVDEMLRRTPVTKVPNVVVAAADAQGHQYTYVPGLDAWLARAAESGSGLAAAGAAWGVAAPAEYRWR